jgi:pimeloyl-ACP methyl ester carboxylesterase
MPVASIGDTTLAYANHGAGPPLLLLHGAMVSRRYWQPQVDHFARRYRVITCDLRGHGESPVSADDYSVAQFTRDIVDLLDRLELDQVVCCGHSLGGMIAQELAISCPERVHALALADTWYYPRGMPWEPFPFRTVALKWMLRTLPVAQLARMMLRGLGAFNPDIQPYLETELQQHFQDRTNSLKIWDAAIEFNSSSRLSAITCPTLILTSAHFLYTYTQALDMCRRIANAEVVMIPRSGHLLNLDNPEAFNSALEGFLERVAW